MHELSIAGDILNAVEESLGGIQTLKNVYLTLGPLSGVNAASLEFCFTTLAEDRGFGKPVLVITQAKAKMHCHDCDQEYEAMDFFDGCPHCGSFSRKILSGTELQVDSVELMEDEDERKKS